MATLVENAAAVKAAAQAIDAAIVAKGGATEGGLRNAAAAIEALPSGGGEPAYPHPWVMSEADPTKLADETHLWYYFPRGGASAFAYFAAQFSISAERYADPTTRFFTVDWGDGTVEEIAATATLANKTLSHQYDDAGEYHVVISDYERVNLSMSAFSSSYSATSYLRGGLAIRQAQIGSNETAIANVNLYGFGILYVEFQNKLTSVGNNVFSSSPWLREIDLSACTSIGGSAFNGCTSLTSVGDLSACTSIGQYAFSGTSITRLVLPALVRLDNSVREMTLLKELSLPVCEHVSFIGCSSLSYVYMPSCKEFGTSAFQRVNGDIVCDFGTKTSADVMAMTNWTAIPARQTCVIRCADGDYYRSGSTLLPIPTEG